MNAIGKIEKTGPLRPIRNRRDHARALRRIGELMEIEKRPAALTAELQVLAILAEKYETQAFPVAPPTPLDAIRFRMEQMGYGQSDLARVLGSRSRASEILSGNLGSLSLSMIRRLRDAWNIPADALV